MYLTNSEVHLTNSEVHLTKSEVHLTSSEVYLINSVQLTKNQSLRFVLMDHHGNATTHAQDFLIFRYLDAHNKVLRHNSG